MLNEIESLDSIYEFANIDSYKIELSNLKAQQKALVKNNQAAEFTTQWTINSPTKEGKQLAKGMYDHILHEFDLECILITQKLKHNNFDKTKTAIKASFNSLNKSWASFHIKIVTKYLDLKLSELQLAYKYELKKQADKEEQMRQRELLREQERVIKEIEEQRKKLLKEQQHYQNHLSHLNAMISDADTKMFEQYFFEYNACLQELNAVDKQLQDIDYREANQNAGYVYVISNIESFGENIYKIGVTRRLNPQDRVDELGSASVPFKFDVHAMIFSQNAFALETALHHEFEDKKVNLANPRKEFFNVTLKEIEDAVNRLGDYTAEFIATPTAEQYYKTLKIRAQREMQGPIYK